MRTSQCSQLSTLVPSLCTGDPHAYRGSVRSQPPLLQDAIAEAFDAWRKGKENAGEEPADVAIDLFSRAGMTGFDRQDEIEGPGLAP